MTSGYNSVQIHAVVLGSGFLIKHKPQFTLVEVHLICENKGRELFLFAFQLLSLAVATANYLSPLKTVIPMTDLALHNCLNLSMDWDLGQ